MIRTPTYGLELEKAFVNNQGDPHAVGDTYFQELAALKNTRHEQASVNRLGSDGPLISVQHVSGDESLDNSFILGESATKPVHEEDGGLNTLSWQVHKSVDDVLTVLEPQHAGILNMANHPLAVVDQSSYDARVVPKPVYGYLREVRRWNHVMGIDAKAQNSPSVGVDVMDAVSALNTVLGFGAAVVGLFANSPFANGRPTRISENRLGLWGDMFQSAHSGWDRRMHHTPNEPFRNLRHYFEWMFGPDSKMFFVSGQHTQSEKYVDDMLIIDGEPSLLQFMGRASWRAHSFNDGKQATIIPDMNQFSMHQFLQFTGARIRYSFLKEASITPSDFMAAMQGTGHVAVEELFAKNVDSMYIEIRDPGANFPDNNLLEQAQDLDVCRSVLLSPAAVHTGIIRNKAASEAAITRYGWGNLIGLRDAAIRDGLQGTFNDTRVIDLARTVIDIARDGLRADERWLLAYPEYVLQTGKNGADRAREMFDASRQPSDATRVRDVIRQRTVTKDTWGTIRA